MQSLIPFSGSIFLKSVLNLANSCVDPFFFSFFFWILLQNLMNSEKPIFFEIFVKKFGKYNIFDKIVKLWCFSSLFPSHFLFSLIFLLFPLFSLSSLTAILSPIPLSYSLSLSHKHTYTHKNPCTHTIIHKKNNKKYNPLHLSIDPLFF